MIKYIIISILLFVNPILCKQGLSIFQAKIEMPSLTEIESEEYMAEESVGIATEMTQPVIIDLGKQRPKALTDLKKGDGKLWDEVLDVIEEVKEMLGAEADGKVLIPVVMLYEEKPSRRRLDLDKILFPLLEEDDDDEDDDDDDEEE